MSEQQMPNSPYPGSLAEEYPRKKWIADDEKIIPRAQYDALMAAAKAIFIIHRAGETDKTLRTWPDVEEEVETLCAAGVDITAVAAVAADPE